MAELMQISALAPDPPAVSTERPPQPEDSHASVGSAGGSGVARGAVDAAAGKRGGGILDNAGPGLGDANSSRPK